MTQVVPFLSVYTIVAGLSGVTTGLLAVWIYRDVRRGDTSGEKRRYSDLVWPFLVVLGLFTAAAFVFAGTAVSGLPEIAFGALTLLLLSVPWAVFALRQAGRGYLLRRWRIVALAATVLPLVVVISLGSILDGDAPQSFQLAASFLSLIPLGMVFVAAGLLLLATYRHGSSSLTGGVLVVLLIVEPLIAVQVTRSAFPVFSASVISASYAAFAVTAVVAVTRYDVLSVRPGTGTLGERVVVNEMSEPVFVVGPEGTIGRSNETAQALFGPDIDGSEFADVLECPVLDLADEETVERWTDRGRVRFDPRVSTLTAGGQTIGYAVTLIDVTDREMRKQRIQVLNRILRHNIRNDLDVVKARAEAAREDGQPVEPQVDTILDVADELETLSADARRIQKLIQRSGNTEVHTELASLIEGVVDAVETASDNEPAIAVDVPAVSLQVDEELLRFALKNIVENAVEHNDTSEPQVEIRGEMGETGLELVVVDDGPGIPPSEQAVIETGGESQLAHATSVGLWGTNWAIQTIGGELSFGESDPGGAAVTINIPAGVIVSDDPGSQ